MKTRFDLVFSFSRSCFVLAYVPPPGDRLGFSPTVFCVHPPPFSNHLPLWGYCILCLFCGVYTVGVFTHFHAMIPFHTHFTQNERFFFPPEKGLGVDCVLFVFLVTDIWVIFFLRGRRGGGRCKLVFMSIVWVTRLMRTHWYLTIHSFP